MISGIIEKWGFGVLDEETKYCIYGEVYDSSKFGNGKLINTSIIKKVYLLNNYLAEDLQLIPNIMVETSNNSKYILGNPSDTFKHYIEHIIKTNSLCMDDYTFKNSKGIVNIINWYLNRNSIV